MKEPLHKRIVWMEKEAREIAESRDIMPKTLKEYQDKIFASCLDMQYVVTQKMEENN